MKHHCNNDIDYLQPHFTKLLNNTKVPDSLSPEAMLEKLSQNNLNDQTVLKPNFLRNYKQLTSVAACFIVMIGFIIYFSVNNSANLLRGDISTAQSYKNIADAAQGKTSKSLFHPLTYKSTHEHQNDTIMQVESINQTAKDDSNISAMYQDTLYTITNNQVFIINTADSMNIENTLYYEDQTLLELFIINKTLYTISQNTTDTFIYAYDIKNQTKPKLINTITQNGTYENLLQFSNEQFITVVTQKPYIETDTSIAYYKNMDQIFNIQTSDIAIDHNSELFRYSILSLIETASSKAVDIKAIFGNVAEVFINSGSADQQYLNAISKSNVNSTAIIQYRVDHKSLNLKSSNKISGNFLSASDYSPNKLLLTQSTDFSTLYLLDNKLTILSKEDLSLNQYQTMYVNESAIYIADIQNNFSKLTTLSLNKSNELIPYNNIQTEFQIDSIHKADSNLVLLIGASNPSKNSIENNNGLAVAAVKTADYRSEIISSYTYGTKNSISETFNNTNAYYYNRELSRIAIPITIFNDQSSDKELPISFMGSFIFYLQNNQINLSHIIQSNTTANYANALSNGEKPLNTIIQNQYTYTICENSIIKTNTETQKEFARLTLY